MDATIPLGKLAPLLFMMMGPIAVMPVFAGLTATAEPAFRLRLALAAAGAAAAALALAVASGASALETWGATPASLIVAAGVLLTIAAMRGVLGLGQHAANGAAQQPTMRLALSPLAFPTMVPPHAIGVLVIFVAYFPQPGQKAAILAVALAILVLNLLAMLVARHVLAVIGLVPLVIMGAVFNVLQVALGIEMILSGLKLSTLFR
jgi:multiple antibiotic resistance protein